jgi:hypothetical protein
MTYINTLLTSLPKCLGGLDFLLLTLLVCALFATFCWSLLGTKLKLAICFTAEVFLFRGFFDKLIDKQLFPDLHNYLPFALGFVTAGLLEISAYLLANRAMIIGIFFGGAIIPLLFFAHSRFFDFEKILTVPALTAIVSILMFGSLAMLKITSTKPFQLIASAIGGGFGTVYLACGHGGVSNIDALGSIALRPIVRMIQDDPLHKAVYLSISGILVQSLLHLVSSQIQHQKSESSKYRTRVQDTV